MTAVRRDALLIWTELCWSVVTVGYSFGVTDHIPLSKMMNEGSSSKGVNADRKLEESVSMGGTSYSPLTRAHYTFKAHVAPKLTSLFLSSPLALALSFFFKWIRFLFSLYVVWVWITDKKKPKGRCSIPNVEFFYASASFSVRTHGASALLLIYGTVNPVRMTSHSQRRDYQESWTPNTGASSVAIAIRAAKPPDALFSQSKQEYSQMRTSWENCWSFSSKWDIRIGNGVRTLAALLLMSPISTAVKVCVRLQLVIDFLMWFSHDQR